MTPPLLEWSAPFLSFKLFMGELLLLQTETESIFSKIINCLTGLDQTQDKIIKINGSFWSELSPYEQTALRGKIRILHKTNAFINNLDLFENISLPLKHHEHFSDDEIMSLLDPFLLLFNPMSFLKLRPYQATDSQLKLTQWIRLFIGSPKLLILQNPDLDTPMALLPKLQELLKKYLNSGGGVLFLNTGKPIVFESLITKRYSLHDYVLLQKPEESP